MKTKNYYELLDISPSASCETINSLFDKIEKRFNEPYVIGAFSTLRDKDRREDYDQILLEGEKVHELFKAYNSDYDSPFEKRIQKIEDIISLCSKPQYLLHYELADYYLDLKNYTEAEKHYSVYLKKFPDDTHAQFKMKEKSYADPEEIQSTHEMYLAELKEAPNDVDTIIEYARELHDYEQRKEAADLIEKCLKKTDCAKEDKITLLAIRGIFYHRDGDNKNAEWCLQKAYRLAKNLGGGAFGNVSWYLDYNADIYEKEWGAKFDSLENKHTNRVLVYMVFTMISGVVLLLKTIIDLFTN